MSDNQPQEQQIQGNSPSENPKEEQPVENETQEEYDMKKLNEEIRATREKLCRLREMKRALLMKKAQEKKQKNCTDLDPEFQQPQENEPWGPYYPQFCQYGPPPFPPHYWKGGPPEMFYGFGPWCFHHKCHKHNHGGKSEWKRQQKFDPNCPPDMQCPMYPMMPPRYPPHWMQPPGAPQQQDNMPPPPKLQRKLLKAQMKEQRKACRKGRQMPPEWAYYYGPPAQRSQEGDQNNSSSSSYSDSGSENETFGPGNAGNPNAGIWGPPM